VLTAEDALASAARALAVGDPLRALSAVGRDDGALALTLRGIAYAQMGDLELARTSLGRAIALGPEDRVLARARAALVEIELESGEPARAAREARACADAFDRLDDTRNAAMQRIVLARAEVLLGRPEMARDLVTSLGALTLPNDVRAMAHLTEAEIAVRRLLPSEALVALRRARACSPHALLARALGAMELELTRPVARLRERGETREANLFGVERASDGRVLLIDGCRRLARAGRVTIPLARRPVLFALLEALARAHPFDLGRDDLARQAFALRQVNPSHRSRLRVEIGRLRKAMDGLAAEPVATRDGYVLRAKREVVSLLPLTDDGASRIASLLSDGAAWSTQSLAEHAGVSKSTARRALASLVARGDVVRTGRGAHVRYAKQGAPVASRMLLLSLVPQP
jgi:tetratricopeptide (TPR) repeat protein